jgi:hypothetical protein
MAPFITYFDAIANPLSSPTARLASTGTVTWALQQSSATIDRNTRRCPATGSASNSALFSTGTIEPGITVTGAGVTVSGLTHSETGISIGGAGNALNGGTEYTTSLNQTGAGNTINPAAQKVLPGSKPNSPNLADFRPNGPEAIVSGQAYVAVPATQCVSGNWTPTAAQLVNGNVYYVPCNVNMSGVNIIRKITIVSEQNITINGAGHQLAPIVSSGPALIAGGTITISGAGSKITGSTTAQGDVAIFGADIQICSTTARKISLAGARTTASSCS